MINNNYNDKLSRIKKAWQREVPDRVPVVLSMGSWASAYYGYNLKDVYAYKLDTHGSEVYKKAADEFNFDAYYSFPVNIPFEMTDVLGGGLYQLNDDLYQIANPDAILMNADEYELMEKDLFGFMMNTLLLRKYPKLKRNPQEALSLLTKANKKWGSFGSNMITAIKEIERAGTPVLAVSGLSHPFDFVMDYLRDISGMLVDIRRQPEQILKLLDVLNEFILGQSPQANITGNDGHMICWFSLAPSMLRPKDFDKFYFPYLKSQLEIMFNYENEVSLFMEGCWEQHYDTLQDLPDNDGMLQLYQETCDFVKFKKVLGAKGSIGGGLPLNVLSAFTEQECIDYTKRLIDDVASGGGFIMGTNKALLTLSDAKPENIKAVMRTVELHGRY